MNAPLCQPPNQQLERTVIRHRVRAASAAAPLCARGAQDTQRAAAQLHVRRHNVAERLDRSTVSVLAPTWNDGRFEDVDAQRFWSMLPLELQAIAVAELSRGNVPESILLHAEHRACMGRVRAPEFGPENGDS